MFFKNRCSCWTVKSYHVVKFRTFLGPTIAETDSLKHQILHNVSLKSMGFFSINVRSLILLNSRKFALKVYLNHFVRVSITNFSSTEKNSDSEVVFSLEITLVAACLTCFIVTGSKNLTWSC